MPTELKNKSLAGDKLITQYDISVIPNDFNINTIFNLIKSGMIEMPFFQRNYVWDKKRASKFIESLALGLPIPQIFLYQKERNKFLVIDGQQRLLTIYYFIHERFPNKDKIVELRKIFDTHAVVPREIFSDDNYFQDFKLQLSLPDSNSRHPLNNLKYNTLGNVKSSFDFATIRCMTIRQNDPKDDDSSIFEIFSRLNTGGVNLSSQEIRACLYHSEFYKMLTRINQFGGWRRLWGKKEEDKKSKDIEVLLRSFAMLHGHASYNGSMNSFINKFAKQMMSADKNKIEQFEKLFTSFISRCDILERSLFETKKGQFNTALFECVFVAACEQSYNLGISNIPKIDSNKVQELKNDTEFSESITHSTSHTKMVSKRISKAKAILL